MIIELVTWLDSASHGDGWHDMGRIKATVEENGLLPIESVGFVVDEDDDSLTLSLAWSPDDHMNPVRVMNPLTIPKAVITERRAMKSLLFDDPDIAKGVSERVSVIRGLVEQERKTSDVDDLAGIRRRRKTSEWLLGVFVASCVTNAEKGSAA